jgi:hypothetical protein
LTHPEEVLRSAKTRLHQLTEELEQLKAQDIEWNALGTPRATSPVPIDKPVIEESVAGPIQ